MEQSNPKWMDYIKTFTPIILLLGTIVIWYASQATRISTLENQAKHMDGRIQKCEQLPKETNGHRYRISSLEQTMKTMAVKVNSINPLIPQVKLNTQNIQFILSKLDRHQDILIEVRTLVKTILDARSSSKVSQPRSGTKTSRR